MDREWDRALTARPYNPPDFGAMQRDAFGDAVRTNNVQKVKKLLGKGADANKVVMERGGTALILACLGGRKEMAGVLLGKGADVDKAAEDGTTPLYVASQQGMNGKKVDEIGSHIFT